MLTAEQNAVLEVIQTENRAFWMKDAATFERCHLHSPESLRWGYWQAGGIMMRRGWDEIGRRSLEHMAILPRPVPEFADAPIHNLNIRVGADMAWVNFEREHPRSGLAAGFGPNGPTYNFRVLEKHEGRWLIAVIGLLDAHLGDEVAVRVGDGGAIVWMSDRGEALLRNDEHFVVRSGKLFARDRRQQARLAKAIERMVALDGQLMPQRGALPMFFDTEAGSTRTVWILPDAATALVMLEDTRPMSERIDLAAQTFALSAAQARLALALAQGQSLATFSDTSGITLNTARTHLKRIFEKVGVNSQAGLVRVLVSLSPPR